MDVIEKKNLEKSKIYLPPKTKKDKYRNWNKIFINNINNRNDVFDNFSINSGLLRICK